MNVFEEEYWLPVWQFPNYKISSLGRVWDKDFDEEVPQTFNKANQEMHVRLKYDASEFKGAVWKLMYATFWQEGWGIGVKAVYRDDDPRNLEMFNLNFDLLTGHPLLFSINEKTGLWGRRRRTVRHIRLIETGEIFPTVGELALAINGHKNTIYMCLRGSQQTHKGYSFEWVD